MIKRIIVRGEDMSPGFVKNVVLKGGRVFGDAAMESVYSCIQCGLCSGGCPSGRESAMLTRELIRLTQLGLGDEILESEDLWQCTTCYLCQERCPRKVKTTDIIRTLRNIAVVEGHISDDHKKIVQVFEKYGHAIPLNEEMKNQRRKLGLQEHPPTIQASASGLEELKKLFNSSGLPGVIR